MSARLLIGHYRKMEYTRESLLTFKTEMERQAVLAKTGGEQGGFGGFGGGGGGGADKNKKAAAKVCYGSS